MHVAFLNPQGNFDRNDSYLTEHSDFGGQLVYVKELSLALARMGVRVDIVTRWIDDPQWPGFAQREDAYDDSPDELRILRVPCGGPRFLAKELLWPHLPEFVDQLLQFYGAVRPDYLTSHYADGGYCAALMQQATGLGFTFTGHSLGAQKLDKLGMTATNSGQFEQCFHFSRRIDAERLAMQRADTIITSTSQERFEQYGHPLYRGAVDTTDDGRFCVVPPGVNTEVFNDEPNPRDDALHRVLERQTGETGGPWIVVSSRLDEKKNIGGVVEAYARSQALQDQARLALFVRGLDDPFSRIDTLPSPERAVLQPMLERIEQAEVRERVGFFNIQSQRDLAAAYRFFARRGSVFVLSSFYEPFGLAPIEAAACGLAVVATRHGGPTEIFADGSAVLVDPFDAGNIADGIASALGDQQRLAAAGKRRVRTRYTWQQTARGYLQAIEDKLGRPRPEQGVVGELDATARIAEYLETSRS